MIAVTAGKQQVGKDVIKSLSEKGYQLKVLVSSKKQLQEFIKLFEKASIEFVIGNLLDVTTLDELIDGVNTVIHLDEMVSFDSSEKNEMYLYNVQGTANVVNVALHHNVQQIIFLSSVWAMGEKSDQTIYNEEAKWVNIKSAKGYGWSKHLAEREIWRGVNEGLTATIFNVGYVTSNLALDEQMRNVLGYFTKKKSFPEGNLELTEMGDLMAIMLQKIEFAKDSEQYIVSNGSVSFKTIMEELVKLKGEKASLTAMNIDDLNQKSRFKILYNLFSSNKFKTPNKLEALMLSDKRKFSSQKLKSVYDHKFIEKEKSLKNLINNYRASI